MSVKIVCIDIFWRNLYAANNKSRIICVWKMAKTRGKSQATLEKYMRDIRHFLAFLGDRKISKRSNDCIQRISGQRVCSCQREFHAGGAEWLSSVLLSAEMLCQTHEIQRQIFLPGRKEPTRQEYTQLVRGIRRNADILCAPDHLWDGNTCLRAAIHHG